MTVLSGFLTVGLIHLTLFVAAAYAVTYIRINFGARLRAADILMLAAQALNLVFLVRLIRDAEANIAISAFSEAVSYESLFIGQYALAAIVLLRFYFLFRRTLVYRQKLMIPRSIREAIDYLPGGLCFCALNGRPILTNRKMNELVYLLTGSAITNALATWEELRRFTASNGCEKAENPRLYQERQNNGNTDDAQLFFSLPDGDVWRFRREELTDKKPHYIQLEASRITDLYRYSAELYANNQRLAAQYRRQQDILANIVDINREKELLHAKMKIHDNLGRSIITTKRRLSDQTLEDNADRLAEIWHSTIASLSAFTRMSESEETSPEFELRKAADMIGCGINMVGDAPADRKNMLLFYATVREALTNAVTHAKANQLFVTVTQPAGGGGYGVRICDNGTVTAAADGITEGSGLRNLREKLEREGATMRVICDNGVSLAVELPV